MSKIETQGTYQWSNVWNQYCATFAGNIEFFEYLFWFFSSFVIFFFAFLIEQFYTANFLMGGNEKYINN